jgi:3-oxoacyl-[acyl-carrier protein] reductase/2-hydroxycyclohexanecarboxyl-CoA dehydrogenase
MFEDRTVLVVGGGSGMGRATAILAAREGGRVAVADVNMDGAEETVRLIGDEGESRAFAVDVTTLESCRRMVAEVLEAFGSIEHLISTVGWTTTTFFMDETPEYWDKVIAINLLGSINVSYAVLEHMQERGGGSITLTSSDAAKVGTMGETVYAAAKAGVIGFVKSLARETARDSIRVNAVSPGATDTPLMRAQADNRGEVYAVSKLLRIIPLKRVAEPEEQAHVLAFLASDRASYITGQTLSVSGGLTMNS